MKKRERRCWVSFSPHNDMCAIGVTKKLVQIETGMLYGQGPDDWPRMEKVGYQVKHATLVIEE